ncbi:unnamed protein product, partial [Pocillopora meandrina]
MTRYDQRAMCNHLVNFLEVLEIMEFPTTEKRVALVIVPVLSETLQIDCTRQLPDDKANCLDNAHPVAIRLNHLLKEGKVPKDCLYFKSINNTAAFASVNPHSVSDLVWNRELLVPSHDGATDAGGAAAEISTQSLAIYWLSIPVNNNSGMIHCFSCMLIIKSYKMKRCENIILLLCVGNEEEDEDTQVFYGEDNFGILTNDLTFMNLWKAIEITSFKIKVAQHVPKGLLSLVQIIMPYLVHAPLDSKGFILNPDCISVIQNLHFVLQLADAQLHGYPYETFKLFCACVVAGILERRHEATRL